MCGIRTYAIQFKTSLSWDGSQYIIYFYPFTQFLLVIDEGKQPYSSLVFTRDYKSHHNMFIIDGKPWGGIVIDHYYRKISTGGVWLGEWVDAINGYDQSEVVYI